MEDPTPKPVAIRARHWRWLTTEAAAWAREGLIDEAQRARIVGRYHVDTAGAERRGFIVLTGLAVLAAAIAVLLVIGYNWDALSRTAKVAIILGAVIAAFTGSAMAYARRHDTTGELLAFAGTLLYGNAIWLLAQVFHISSHYPNGALWWMIGALATAHLLPSRLIAVDAIVLLAVWLEMEGAGFARPNYLFVPFGALAIWLAYRVRSALVLILAALVAVAWIVTTAGVALDAGRLAIPLGALAGCASYAAGLWDGNRSRFRRAWQGLGLFTLGVFLVPLMVHDLHERESLPELAAFWPVLLIAALLAAFVGTIAARSDRDRQHIPVWLAAAASAAWMAARVAAPDLMQLPGMAWGGVIAFSGVTLAAGIWMMRTGMRVESGWLFAGGVGYVLLLVLVRWVDLLGNMLWSAVFLIAAAGALFWMARLWRSRERTVAAGGLES